MLKEYEELVRKLIESRGLNSSAPKPKLLQKPKTASSQLATLISASDYHKDLSENKAQIVNKILIRWWYGLPDWPPVDYDYTSALKARNLFLISEGKHESPSLSRGLVIVVNIEGYPGIFQDSMGRFYDLRPAHLCPSYNNLMQKSTKELNFILIRCLENQLAELLNTSNYSINLVDSLRQEISACYNKLG
jgi:hypothetical protein